MRRSTCTGGAGSLSTPTHRAPVQNGRLNRVRTRRALGLAAAFVLVGTAGASSTPTRDEKTSLVPPATPDAPAGVQRSKPRPEGYAVEYGMNPSFSVWSSRAIVFADGMARAAEFGKVNGPLVAFGGAPLIPLGQGKLGEGWPDFSQLAPGETAGTVIFGDLEGALPDGRTTPYVVVWEGTGSVTMTGVNVVGEQKRTANRVEIFVDPSRSVSGQLSVVFESSSPADPVRNVHVWLPGMENSGELFWPPYLERVRAMNGGSGPHTWRTLDWTRVNDYGADDKNGAFTFDLAGRIKPSSPSQGTRRGMCTEFQVAFCNAVGANLHLTIPHRTDDMSEADYETYVRQTLLAVRDGSPAVPPLNGGKPFEGLDEDLTLTVELSNEIWNVAVPANKWMSDEATRKGITLEQQVASEIQNVFDIADSIFTGDDRKRLRKFVGALIATQTFVDKVLRELRPGTHVDAIGPAIYFGPRTSVIDGWLQGASQAPDGPCPNCPTAQEVITEARNSINDLRPLVAAHRAIADAWINPDGSSPALEMYEGGAAFLAFSSPWQPAAAEASTLPELYDAYVDDLVPMLIDEGVDLVNWYSFMTDQDATLPPFGIWNDMNQEITLPVVDGYRDEGAPKAAAVYKGPPLKATAKKAALATRNVGTNVNSYSTTRPVLGTTLIATVDLRTTGHASALLYGRQDQAQIAVGDGQYVLIQGGLVSELPMKSGSVVTWRIPIPNDASILGFELSTQALHVDPVKPYALSNAVDLTLGRD